MANDDYVKELSSDPVMAESTVDELVEIRTLLRRLANAPEWVYIRQVLESQANQRYTQAGQFRVTSIDDFVRQTEFRAEADALLVLRDLPAFMLGAIEVQLEATEENQNNV